jgi:ABC-type polysaccharide/polyol phosphate export permease
MAMQDVRLRYRGSILGPFWLTISTVIMVVAIGVIYSRLFNMETQKYLPFLTVGLVVWQFISTTMTEGCDTFFSAKSIIQQLRLPFSVYVYRTVYRNLIVLAHNMLIVPAVLLLFQVEVGWSILAVVPALVVITVNGVWVATLLGMLGARYRDLPPIVTSLIQVVFFVTPIFWPPEALGNWAPFLPLNPMFAALDVIRAPLLGIAPMPYSWTVLLVVTVLGCAGSFLIFAKFRSRIAYWV